MAGRRLIAAAAVVAALTGACGDDPPTEDELAAVAALVAEELPGSERDCIIDGLDTLEIEPARVADDDLDADENGELLALTVECVADLATIEAFVDSFIDGAADAGTTLTREQARCAIRGLEAEDPDAAVAGCLVDVADVPLAEGDDPVLDLLVEQCRRGNNQACDELYADAPSGSEYATYGRTCGNRLPDGTGLTCFDELG